MNASLRIQHTSCIRVLLSVVAALTVTSAAGASDGTDGERGGIARPALTGDLVAMTPARDLGSSMCVRSCLPIRGQTERVAWTTRCAIPLRREDHSETSNCAQKNLIEDGHKLWIEERKHKLYLSICHQKSKRNCLVKNVRAHPIVRNGEHKWLRASTRKVDIYVYHADFLPGMAPQIRWRVVEVFDNASTDDKCDAEKPHNDWAMGTCPNWPDETQCKADRPGLRASLGVISTSIDLGALIRAIPFESSAGGGIEPPPKNKTTGKTNDLCETF